MKASGHAPEGESRDQLAHGCDWLPTLAEYCGARPLNPDLDGLNKDVEDKRKDASRINSDIAAIDQRLRGTLPPQERTELNVKRRALVDQGFKVDRELQQNPPSALMKRLLQVETDLANHRQCVTKARADLEAYVTSLGVKAKP